MEKSFSASAHARRDAESAPERGSCRRGDHHLGRFAGGAERGGEVTLTDNVTAGEGDEGLIVPAGKTVMLDLAGKTIDRHLNSKISYCYVIKVVGTLTITDSSDPQTGTITGGNNSFGGYSPDIGGCQAGAIEIDAGATVNLRGGIITGNHANHAAAVVVEENEDHPADYFYANDVSYGVVRDRSEAMPGKYILNNISFVERAWDGSAVTSSDEIMHEAQRIPNNGAMTSGWYYLDRDITVNGRIESITGDVHLILGDGYTLDVKGLYVPAGSTLTIYGQSGETGKLYSHPSSGGAIGGCSDSDHDCGSIVIHSGTVYGKTGSEAWRFATTAPGCIFVATDSQGGDRDIEVDPIPASAPVLMPYVAF